MRYLVVPLLAATIARAQDATLSGFVDLGYAFNSNRPDNHESFYPGAGTTAKRATEFALNLAQVQWTRPASAEQVGFTLAAVAGDGADVVQTHVYHASVAYRLKNGLVLEGGIYPSHIGVESFYSKDNWNYTRSILMTTMTAKRSGHRSHTRAMPSPHR